jgi:hypothetical protein
MTVDVSDDKERCRAVLSASPQEGFVAVLDFHPYAGVPASGQARVRLNRRQCQRLIAELQRLLAAAPAVAGGGG